MSQTKNIHKLTLISFIKALFDKTTPLKIKLIVGMALAYTVFPADILPDIFGPLGFVDDAAAITILTSLAMNLLEQHRMRQPIDTKDVTPNLNPYK